MNDQDQNIAVAKFHGYKIESGSEHNCRYKITDTGGGVCYCDYLDGHIPDYGKDLNAINQVEVIIYERIGWHPVSEFPWPYHYAVELSKLGLTGEPAKIHASASQRREALLRCLNLYVEE